MKKKKSNITTVLLVVLLLAGLSLLLYPSVSDYWNSFHQTRAIASYAEEVANLDDAQYEEIWEAAKAYNSALLSRENGFVLTSKQREEYEKQLDVTGLGIMGYIEIPAINVSLPIYHGTEESVLQVAVGHLEWSSLPVGGEGTHCVLSGHRGLPSAKLFTNLDKLEEGDIFMIRVLDETLTYEVDQVLIVLPSETEALNIDPEKDYCTLVTCTPYAVNTHRLLVRGHRIENLKNSDEIKVTSDAVQIDPMIVAPIVAAPILIALVVAVVTGAGKKRKKKSKAENGEENKNDKEES